MYSYLLTALDFIKKYFFWSTNTFNLIINDNGDFYFMRAIFAWIERKQKKFYNNNIEELYGVKFM